MKKLLFKKLLFLIFASILVFSKAFSQTYEIEQKGDSIYIVQLLPKEKPRFLVVSKEPEFRKLFGVRWEAWSDKEKEKKLYNIYNSTIASAFVDKLGSLHINQFFGRYVYVEGNTLNFVNIEITSETPLGGKITKENNVIRSIHRSIETILLPEDFRKKLDSALSNEPTGQPGM